MQSDREEVLLDELGGEPLEGSGFEQEDYDLDFETEDSGLNEERS
jgi:hypothetical protein